MKLSYGRLWEDMVALFRSHSELLLAIAGVFLFLPSLLTKILVSEPQISGDGLAALEQYLVHYRQNLPTIFLLSLPSSLGQASILALLLDPSRPTVAVALQRGLSLLISFVVLNMLINLSIALGTMLLVLPGLYMIGRTFVSGPALMAERIANPLAAFRRGFEMAVGNGWSIFFMLAVLLIVAIIVSSAATSVAGVFFTLVGSVEMASIATALVASVFDMFVALALTLFGAALYRALRSDSR